MLLRVGRELPPAFMDRPADADRRQYVLQRLARSHMHRDLPGCDDGYAVPVRNVLDDTAVDIVHRTLVKRQRHPASSGKRGVKPFKLRIELRLVGRIVRHEDRHAVGHAAKMRDVRFGTGQILWGETITAFRCTRARQCDQLRKIPVAFPILREQDDPERQRAICIREPEVRTDHQRQAGLLRGNVGAHHTSKRAFVGDSESCVAELCGARRQFLGVRRAGEEREVGKAEQLGVRRQHERGTVHGASSEQAMQIPAWLVAVAAANPLAVYPIARVVLCARNEIVARDQAPVIPARLDPFAG
ncbi:hypothetical protein FEP90_03693 [Burkholderia multivorans]|nr:hypothetical protein [Burkholderia multivorans]